MITWQEVIAKAIAAYKSGKYVYLYGAKNVLLKTEAQIREYFNREPAYFARYTETEKKQIIKNSLGKYAIDCSGFTGWVCTGDKQYSIGQINNCSKYNTLQAGPTGSLLFTTWGNTGRHIGLDVGNGYAMHIGWESTNAAIKEGRAGILFEPIRARAWEKSGQSKVVDYTGAYSPYEPITELLDADNSGANPGPETPADVWFGEAFGAALIPVYSTATKTTRLKTYPNLATGNMFEVLEDADKRWKIRISNKYIGYIDKQYCLRHTPTTTGIVKVSLHLRQNAGTDYNSLCVMPKGAVVQVCDTKPNKEGAPWYYVIYNQMYGFCSATHVEVK